ncbi:MAG: hypothetical protein P9M11_08390 [Candidatus Tenebribacter burtonii]|nr:hypothetical protein [Candidatus Tenebribacter burtonii]
MKNVIILILTLLVIGGCVTHNEIYKQKTQDRLETPPLLKWIYNTPESFVVGISQKSMSSEKMQEAAKQMAAVMESRNSASYIIEKYAATSSDNTLKSNVIEFKLNVSSSPQKTEQIYNSLELVDSIEVLGYFFGLFSTINKEVSTSFNKAYIQRIPEYFEKDKLEISGNTINCYNTKSSSSLISAWENAAIEARYEIAKYFEKKVQSAIINTDVITEKRIALETSEKLSKMKLKSSFITTELKDNLRTFKVYHEMEIIK